jgi:transcriptional regulator with XRE-family HTH domain
VHRFTLAEARIRRVEDGVAGIPAPAWNELLHRVRRGIGLTRDAAAARANISPATLKAYELGARHPTRDSLSALLIALQADPLTRDSVLSAAGFAPDGRSAGFQLPDPWYTFPEAAAFCHETTIPCCLTNQFFEVVAANGLIQRLWEEDLNRSRTGPYERSFLAMLTRRDVADHLLNWEEAISFPIGLAKGHYGGDMAATREANPYFAGAVDHLLKGDMAYVQRFLALWVTVPARHEKYRWWYPIVWQRGDGVVFRFQVLVNPADRSNLVAFNDWMPADGATWEALAAMVAEPSPIISFTAALPGQPGPGLR